MARRFDRSQFPKAEITPQGYLRAHAFATRIGVFPYRMNDGTIKKEYRPAEEVFKPESMKTLAGVAMTNRHPKEELLDPSNTKKHMIGFTGENVTVADNKFLSVMTTITDQDSIDTIKEGQRELSCGYTCDLVPEPGIFEGEQYDFVQRNIVYNHLASVPKGRMGAESQIHLDADDGEMVDSNQKENTKMPKIKIGEKEYDASPELHAAHEALMQQHKKEMDDMKSELESERAKGKQDLPEQKKEMGDMQKKMDAIQARLDAAEAELKKDPATRNDTATINSAVKERMALIETARKVVDQKVKLDEMSNEEIMKEVVKADNKDVNLDDKSAEYVKARYDFVAERLGKSAQSSKDLGAAIISMRNDAETPDQEKSRQKMMDEAKTNNKTKIGYHLK